MRKAILIFAGAAMIAALATMPAAFAFARAPDPGEVASAAAKPRAIKMAPRAEAAQAPRAAPARVHLAASAAPAPSIFLPTPSSGAKAPTAGAPLTPQSVAKSIQGAATPDLNYAIKLATAANTVQSKVRLQCYQAILAAIATPSDIGDPPTPDLVTQAEQLAELVDALQPTSPVFVNCAGAAQLAQLSVLQLINTLVTGAAAAAVLAPKP